MGKVVILKKGEGYLGKGEGGLERGNEWVEDHLLGNFAQGHLYNMQHEKLDSCLQKDSHHNPNNFHLVLLCIKHIGCVSNCTLKMVKEIQNCTSKTGKFVPKLLN